MKAILLALLLIISISAKRHIKQGLPQCFIQSCNDQVKACKNDEGCWDPMIDCLNQSYTGGARGDDLINQAKECVNNQNAIDFIDCTYTNCHDDYNTHHHHHRFY